MPSLQQLGLGNERVGDQIDYATIPDQLGSFQEPPQPGSYRFKLPAKMDAIWDGFEVTTTKTPGTRSAAKFDDSSPLLIVQSPGGVHDGEPFTTRITNAERRRGKKDDANAPEVSDMDYLLRDSFGIAQKPATNPAYAQTLMKLGGQEFTADVEWGWNCSQTRDIYVDNGQGGSMQLEGKKGCGSRYYQKDVDMLKVPSNPDDPNSPKVFPLRITCSNPECGATIRAFPNLVRFRK